MSVVSLLARCNRAANCTFTACVCVHMPAASRQSHSPAQQPSQFLHWSGRGAQPSHRRPWSTRGTGHSPAHSRLRPHQSSSSAPQDHRDRAHAIPGERKGDRQTCSCDQEKRSKLSPHRDLRVPHKHHGGNFNQFTDHPSLPMYRQGLAGEGRYTVLQQCTSFSWHALAAMPAGGRHSIMRLRNSPGGAGALVSVQSLLEVGTLCLQLP
ncbi:hypothetical protein NDU88_006308 [Pleurodeles waltl]|uniref:Uncharacterized protein n=1 Tax=Pleurodeles waltl TaxID=8319 RepID=A0AAV7TZY0_PLEWA|nr:hypothetical protein NDU88_006308 [Pleurodeles waltl]